MNDNITIKIENLNLYLNNDIESKYENTMQIPKTLEEYSWKEIDEIVKKGLHTKLFRLGDTKSFKLGNEVLIAQIADFDHDDLSDGTGKAGISFIIKDCMTISYNMGSLLDTLNTNIIGWSGSEMYKYLDITIYNQLPTDLQSVIKPVNKVTGIGNHSTILQTLSNKLWLMSRKEVSDTNSYSGLDEGNQYPIFTDNASRIKQQNGLSDFYWLRSPCMKDLFYIVDYNGNFGYDFLSNENGVAFGFCI